VTYQFEQLAGGFKTVKIGSRYERMDYSAIMIGNTVSVSMRPKSIAMLTPYKKCELTGECKVEIATELLQRLESEIIDALMQFELQNVDMESENG
jgi:hypothetical protein